MGRAVKDIDHGWKRMLATVKAAKGAHVVVGVLSDGKPRREGGALTNAQLASVHEFGSSDGHVPERSFLRATVDHLGSDHRRFTKALADRVLAGRMNQRQALEVVGQRVVGEVQKRITTGIPPRLKPATIARKGSSTPLIDSGQLRSSVTYEVREGKPDRSRGGGR